MQPRLITDEERQAYGDEALSVMERKAREVMQPVVQDMQRQNQQLRGELQRVKSNDIWSTLDQHLPNWREINQDQGWKDWLTERDIYSGATKQQLLNQAFAAGDANRVLTFFNGFLSENAPQPAARVSSAACFFPLRRGHYGLQIVKTDVVGVRDFLPGFAGADASFGDRPQQADKAQVEAAQENPTRTRFLVANDREAQGPRRLRRVRAF
jgi:hypothetical protein